MDFLKKYKKLIDLILLFVFIFIITILIKTYLRPFISMTIIYIVSSPLYKILQKLNIPKKVSAVYLKLKDMDCSEFKKAKNLLEIFDGPTPVVLYLSESKKQLMAPQNLWVDVNDVLLRELRKLLGEDSVKLKFTE